MTQSHLPHFTDTGPANTVIWRPMPLPISQIRSLKSIMMMKIKKKTKSIQSTPLPRAPLFPSQPIVPWQILPQLFPEGLRRFPKFTHLSIVEQLIGHLAWCDWLMVADELLKEDYLRGHPSTWTKRQGNANCKSTPGLTASLSGTNLFLSLTFTGDVGGGRWVGVKWKVEERRKWNKRKKKAREIFECEALGGLWIVGNPKWVLVYKVC